METCKKRISDVSVVAEKVHEHTNHVFILTSVLKSEEKLLMAVKLIPGIRQ